MTEDSGAFKTNLRIRAGFRHNIMIRHGRGRDAALLEKRRAMDAPAAQTSHF
jgi:hypothetical protein